jgi:hypothetical protein
VGVGGYRTLETFLLSAVPAFGEDKTPESAGSQERRVFHPIGHLFNYLYKGEWHLTSFEENPWPIERLITSTEALFTMKQECGL